MSIRSLSLLILAMFAAPASAEVRLPKILASKMVLQRESSVRIWGHAKPGENVRVSCDWLDSLQKTVADEQGAWEVTLQTKQAGGPHTITVQGADNKVVLEDILFGEVWIGSGQSNMEMPLIKVSGAYTAINNSAEEVAQAKHPMIRLFQAGNFSSKEPLEDVESGIVMYGIPPAKCQWQECSPETIPTFSSTAYFFARQLHQELKVPIGVIDASWGGTSAEAWSPVAVLKELGYTAALKQAETAPQKPDQKIPTRLYNGMIHPLRKFKIQGVVWYQGESNAGRANKYRELFSAMIQGWRKAFNDDFSFYFVQISPFNYGNNSAPLREAQMESLATPKTGMAVTMDIGNLTDIHPKNKQEVGRRLALWALAHDYDQDVVFSGPLYKEVKFAEGEARVQFDHADGGLATRDNKPPSHFEIAGEDQVFHPAAAKIEGDHLVVSSDKVAQPKAVRYAFTSNATPNLTNKAGLPASSFRTDRW